MANINSDRYNAPVQKPMSGVLAVQWASAEILAPQSANDTITWFDIPQDVFVIDGWLRGDDIDTGTETYELDIGTSDDTDKYLNSGVITGDAVTGVKPVGILERLNQNWVATSSSEPFGAATTSEETIIGTVVAAPAGGGTGKLGLYMLYTSA